MFWHEYFKQGRQVRMAIIPGRQTAASHLRKEVTSNLTGTATSRLAAGVQISLNEHKPVFFEPTASPFLPLHLFGPLEEALGYLGNEVELHAQNGPPYPHYLNHPLDNAGK